MILNVVPSRYDPRDYQAVLDTSIPLPSRVDLRLPTDIIKDQLQVGSCTGHNSTSTLEYLGQTHNIFEQLSPRFAYTATETAEGRIGLGGTYSMRDVLETLRKLGVCTESECPYLNTETPPTPDTAAYTSALTRKVGRYVAVPLGLVYNAMGPSDVSFAVANVKAALAQGHRIIIALAIGKKMTQFFGTPLNQQYYPPVAKPWLGKDDPNWDNTWIGGHGLEIVGFDENGWIYKNQWGKTWGDQGYGRMAFQATQDWSEGWIVRSWAGISTEDPIEYAARHQVVTAYVACLNRAPDRAGLLYWAAGGLEDGPLYDSLLGSPEGRALHSSPGAALAAALSDENMVRFQNCVTVAAYCALDLGCDQAPVYNHALDLVTADVASIDAAKFWIRQHMTGGGGSL